MPAQESSARHATEPGEPARQAEVRERDTQVAPALASVTVRHSGELRRRVAAALQRAEIRLRRSDTLLASSHRRLAAHSYDAKPTMKQPAEGVVPSRAL